VGMAKPRKWETPYRIHLQKEEGKFTSENRRFTRRYSEETDFKKPAMQNSPKKRRERKVGQGEGNRHGGYYRLKNFGGPKRSAKYYKR